MAIYRKGQASMDADGYITGYGTNWKTALTLIRPGATIVFATNPVAYATISEIVNDTSLRATSTGGAVVPQSDYVILLHDSITVDGLAQDVAETLRYYQGQETMYQEFVEFLKNFEWQKLEAIDAKVKENAAAAAGSAANALQSEQNAFVHSQNASTSASAAAASESASKKSETNAAASAAASDASKNESQAAAAISTNASNSASASRDAAAQSAAIAKSEADRAADLATQLDATSLMRKDANLSDVADRRSAVNNLGLGWIDDSHGYSFLSSPDLSRRLALGNDGVLVWQTKDGQTIPIAVTSGGTGASDDAGARKNLRLDAFITDGSEARVYDPINKNKYIFCNDSDLTWGAYDLSKGSVIPLSVSCGGTGAADASSARKMLGVGDDQHVTFALVDAKQNNGNNGGIFQSNNYNSDGVLISQSRFYSEIQNGVGKTTIHTAANNKNVYLQYDENGNLTGINDIYAGSVNCNKSISCAGWISANQGGRVGLTTQSGGNKDIFLNSVGDDGNVGSWVNLLQGNWYDGYWQLGAIRGGGADISAVRLGVNNAGSDWKWFDFNNSYGGHITALRGFKGQCVAGAWTLDNEYMGAPFYADTTINNDGGYSPVVAGGTRASTGYDIRYSFGAISGGTGSWPRTAIHMLGDATHHRAFEFFVDGRIYTWDNANQWGGAFEFQRVANSDRDLKKDIEYNDGKASYDNIMKFKPSTFVYKSDKCNRLRRGVIAQDLYEIDPEYVRIIPGAPIIDNEAGTDEEGNLFITDYHDDTLGLDNNVIMIDTALATRYIGGIVEKQQEEIDNLKSEIEELKALIKALQ